MKQKSIEVQKEIDKSKTKGGDFHEHLSLN